MPNQGEWNSVEPGIPLGTNAGLLSSSGTPIHSDMGTGSPSGLMGRVSGVVDSGKSLLADGLHGLGDRIEHTGRDLESGNVFVRPVARVLNGAGEALEDGAAYLRTNDVAVIRDDVVEGIRHSPLMAAGIALGTGWLLGKLGGSDDEEEREERDEPRRQHEEEEHEDSEHSSMMEMLRGRVSDVLAGGFASMAARRIRERIAG